MDSCQASHGSSSNGQVSAFQRLRSGTGMLAMALLTVSTRRSRSVAFGGSRLFIDATACDGDTGAIGRLRAIDDDVGGGRGEFHTLHAGGMQYAVKPAHGDV